MEDSNIQTSDNRPIKKNKEIFCICGKKYISKQSLFVHIKAKHPNEFKFDSFFHRKRGRPKSGNSPSLSTARTSVFSMTIPDENLSLNSSMTCDEVLKKYLQKMIKKLDKSNFATIKCSLNALRDCINKHPDKFDSNYFFSDDLYSTTERPGLIPRIFNFFILEFLPNTPFCKSEDEVVHFIIDFSKWLLKKKYTDIDINLN